MKKKFIAALMFVLQILSSAQTESGILNEIQKSQPTCDDITKNAIRLIVLNAEQNVDSLNLIMSEWGRVCVISEPCQRTDILLQLKNGRSIKASVSVYAKYCLPSSTRSYYFPHNDNAYNAILKEYTMNLADSLTPLQTSASDELLWCLYFGSDQAKFKNESAKECYEGHILYARPTNYSGRNRIDDFALKLNSGVGVCIPTGPISKTIGINTTARIGLDLYNHENLKGVELRLGAKIIGNQSGVTSEKIDSVSGNIEAIYSFGLNGYQDFPINKKVVFRAGVLAGIDVLSTNFKIENDTASLKIITSALTPSIGLWTHRVNKSNYGFEISYAPSLFFLNNDLQNDLRGGFFEVVLRLKFHVMDRW